MALPAPGLYSRVRTLLPELLKFGIVGGIGTVVDLGGAAVLHGKYHVEPLAAKAVSTSLATVITYLGSRFWTFKHRENQELKREAVLFIVLNLVGLAIAEIVVGLVTYGAGLHGQLEYNAASFVGTGFGTIFRYFAYRKWVFLAPDERADVAPAAVPAVPDFPPWEMDPAFFAQAAQRPAAPRPAAPRPSAAPEQLSPWGQQPPSVWSKQPASSWNQAPAAPAWGAPGTAPAAWGAPGAAPAAPRPARQAPSPVAAPAAQRSAHPMPATAPAAQRPARPMPATAPAAQRPAHPAPAGPRPSGRHRKS